MKKSLWFLASSSLVLACAPRLVADVTLPVIFGDHMVLQEGLVLPVWGTAAPGEAVKVSVGDHKGSAVADAKGAWMVKLDPLPTNGQPVDVTISGTNTLVFHDVLVGDVWVCSGQSNMEFGIGNAGNAAEVIPKADNPQIRLFMVARTTSLTPQTDLAGFVAGSNHKSEWQVCTPTTVKDGGWNGFSAVGYFFGREIQQRRNVPIGLIGTYWGGTPAQAWTDFETLQGDPVLSHYADEFAKTRDKLPELKTDFDTKILPAWQQEHDAWKQKNDQALTDWKTQADAATKSGQPEPSKPKPEKEPKKPEFAGDSAHLPTVLFNGMISPLLPYGIKGVIWYQGEANANMNTEYRTLFSAMITDWRKRWAEGNFPFLFVQLANWQPLPKTAGEGSGFAFAREAQLKALDLPSTGMAVTVDLGTADNIHPPDKLDVGLRLSLAARHVAYGETLVYTGPIYDSIKVEANTIRVSFKPDSLGGGLTIGSSPWTDPKAAPISKTELQGFAIAGADNNWVWADAKIDGNTVVVSSSTVTNPVAVRYAWANNPPCNLYNKDGLPASPFRTDQ